MIMTTSALLHLSLVQSRADPDSNEPGGIIFDILIWVFIWTWFFLGFTLGEIFCTIGRSPENTVLENHEHYFPPKGIRIWLSYYGLSQIGDWKGNLDIMERPLLCTLYQSSHQHQPTSKKGQAKQNCFYFKYVLIYWSWILAL